MNVLGASAEFLLVLVLGLAAIEKMASVVRGSARWHPIAVNVLRTSKGATVAVFVLAAVLDVTVMGCFSIHLMRER